MLALDVDRNRFATLEPGFAPRPKLLPMSQRQFNQLCNPQTWRWPLWLALLLCGTAVANVGPGVAPAALTISTAYALNPDGDWTIEQAAAADYRPFAGPLSLGNRNVPTWLRITVPPVPAGHAPLVLMVEPANLNELLLHSPKPDGAWAVQAQGNRYAYAPQGRDTLAFAWPIAPDSTVPTTYYLRVHSITALVYPQVLTMTEVRSYDTGLHLLVGLCSGLALVFLLISLTAWGSTRDVVWGASAFFDLATLVQLPLHMGLVAKFVARDLAGSLPVLTALSSVVHLLAGSVFFWALFRALQAPRWCALGYQVAAAAMLVGLALLALGHASVTLMMVNLALLLLALWAGVVIWFIRPQDSLLRWGFRVMYGGLVLYIAYWAAPIVRLGEAGGLSLYPTLPSHFFTMLMALLILGRRTWLQAESRKALELAARDSAQRFQQEQARHAETAGFLGMLMHEIKNPLTSIRMATEMLSSGRALQEPERAQRHRNIQDAVDGIDTVLRRCLDMDRLERGVLTVERSAEDVAALTRLWVAQHAQAARLVAEVPESRTVLLDVPLYVLMLSNLVDNALKYSPADSPVTLSWQEGNGLLTLTVRNRSGREGLPDPARLFEKYYRSPKAQRHSGTGLGLYWVRSVCTMLGGRVDYRADGEDAVFTLSLPT